uniref:Uncharacterized protein n=1 Tax=Arundo donax TaxID=35708 RepID=A0A0A9G5X9_ARUDO
MPALELPLLQFSYTQISHRFNLTFSHRTSTRVVLVQQRNYNLVEAHPTRSPSW